MPRNVFKIISQVVLLLAAACLFTECSRPRVGVTIVREPCDLDDDGDCDQKDFALFRKALGQCTDDDRYNQLADADHDGCVSEADGEQLFPVIPFYVDIKPDSCPNLLNLSSEAVLPVAVLGTSAHDVASIDPKSVTLEGEPSIRSNVEDVATPPDHSEECATRGVDGFADLTLEFDAEAVVAALDSVNMGDVVVLTLEGDLLDGTPIEGRDVIRIFSGEEEAPAEAEAGMPKYTLFQNYPNPFWSGAASRFAGNPSTEIRFELPKASYVVLKIFSTLGNEIRTLADGHYEAGYHSVRWDGKDMNGKPVTSGVYLCQIRIGAFSSVKKTILMR